MIGIRLRLVASPTNPPMNSSIHSISFGPGGASKSNNQEQLIVTLAATGGKLKASSWRREFQRRFLRAFKRRHLKAGNSSGRTITQIAKAQGAGLRSEREVT